MDNTARLSDLFGTSWGRPREDERPDRNLRIENYNGKSRFGLKAPRKERKEDSCHPLDANATAGCKR